MSGNGATWTFAYDANGMRTSRSNGSRIYGYVYNGGSLSQMTVGGNTLYFAYDASGTPLSVTYNGTNYYYATNLQGDVTAILNTGGTAVVQYTYDAWGNILTTTGSMASTLGTHNPLCYRGYVYDTETALYYLQSRYYNPGTGRFINADALVSTGQGLLGNNMFAYCRNNPVIRKDASGTEDVSATDFNQDDNPLNDLGSPSGGGSGGVGSGSPTQNPHGLGSNSPSGKMRTPDQQALHDLAKEIMQDAKQGKFISYEEAKLIDSWAAEYGVYQHHGAIIGSGSHWVTGWDHTHVYNIHVPFANIY